MSAPGDDTEVPPAGRRVVVRRLLTTGQASDVLGTLLDAGDPLIVERDAGNVGEVVRIARADVVAMKSVPPRPIRASEIRSLDLARARAWWSVEREWVEGWLCRSGRGLEGRRANSATALLPEASAAAVPALRQWYAERDAPLLLQVGGLRPAPEFSSLHTPVDVLVATNDAGLADPRVLISDKPDQQWLALTESAEALAVSAEGTVRFASLVSDGATVAGARLSLTADAAGNLWGGVAAVAAHPAYRRRGLARRIVGHVLAVAAQAGAERSFLEVTADNDGAQRLYRSMGFTVHHSYGYWSDPMSDR